MDSLRSIDYDYFVNEHESRRRPAITRELTKLLYNAVNTISLAEGMPNEGKFPFESVTVKLKDGESFCIKGQEMSGALQYISTQGYPPLLEIIKEFTYLMHKPPRWDNSDIIITSGSQCGLNKVLEMCLVEGCPVLVQNPLYSGTEIVLKPFRPILLPIEQDTDGVMPQNLLKTLQDWEEKCKLDDRLKMPKMLYVNPTGANPTGTTIPLQRKKEIYRICCNYNILILEDDPYYFMDFNCKPLSFLSLDVEGRVIRLDSLSKMLGSGLRIGWATGPKQLIRKVELHIQSSYLHTSTLCQTIVENLFRTWGFEKLLLHFGSLNQYYKSRRDVTLASMEYHLTGLCDWTIPSGGLFVWIKVLHVADVYDMLMTRGLKKHVAFAPGHGFMTDPSAACPYIRAAYSRASPKQIDKAMRLLAELILEEQVLVRKKLESVI